MFWPTAVRQRPDSPLSRWQTQFTRRAGPIEPTAKSDWQEETLWRAPPLPDRKQTESAALLRLKLWASSLDPDFEHLRHVARLSLQLYDGLAAMAKASSAAQERDILQAAALLHDVGRFKDEKGHHKASYQMIRRLPPPLGWRARDLLTAGIIARITAALYLAPDRGRSAVYLLDKGKA
jgi:hypothetical protein